MSFKKILLVGSLFFVASLFIANVAPCAVEAQGTVNLPACRFSDKPGIYAKHVLCGWEDDRCEINTSIPNIDGKKYNCRQTCWGINIIKAGQDAGVLAATFPSFPSGTRLCTTTSLPSEVNIPACPFDGDIGDVWVKPGLTPWNEGSKCRVGDDCWQQPLEISFGSVDIYGYQIDAGGSLNIKTRSDAPGAAYAHSQATVLPIVWWYDTCIVKSSTSGDTPPGETPPPSDGEDYSVSGTLSAPSTSVTSGEDFTVKIEAQDANGVKFLWLKTGPNNTDWQKYPDNDIGSTDPNLTHEWTFSSTPGTRTFSGYVEGIISGSSQVEGKYTSPKTITITVGSGDVPPVNGEDYPVSGTLSAPSTSVTSGEDFTVKIEAQDANGVKFLWLKTGPNNTDWQKYPDNDIGSTDPNLTHEWTFSSTPGTRTFSGYVEGIISGSSQVEGKYTSPKTITITVGSGDVPPVNGEDYPVSGTLSAPSTSVTSGEDFTVKIEAQDANGVKFLWLKTGPNNTDWQKYPDNDIGSTDPNLTHEWTFSSTPGTRTFSGYVEGIISGSSQVEGKYTSPKTITITVGSGDVPPVNGEDYSVSGTLPAPSTSPEQIGVTAEATSYEKGDLTSDWESNTYDSGYYDVSNLMPDTVAEGVQFGRGEIGKISAGNQYIYIHERGGSWSAVCGFRNMSEEKFYCDNGDYYYIGSPLAVWKNGRRLSAGTTTVSSPKINGEFVGKGNRAWCLYCSTGDHISGTSASTNSRTCWGTNENCQCTGWNRTGGDIYNSVTCNKNYDQIKVVSGENVDFGEGSTEDPESTENVKPLPKCPVSWGKGKIWVEACAYYNTYFLGCGHAEYGTDARTFYAENSIYGGGMYIHTYSKAKLITLNYGRLAYVMMYVQRDKYIETKVTVCMDY